MSNSYVLTETRKRILESRGYEFVCARCRKHINIGEKVVSRPHMRARLTERIYVRTYYHEACWGEMFI